MKSFNYLVKESLSSVTEVFPWDLETELEQQNADILLVDIREPYEFEAMHLKNSINIPRGILETACEWGFEETVPRLVEARENSVVLACRSGNRTILAAAILAQMGYSRVRSLKTGLRGWNDYELPLYNAVGNVSIDEADIYFEPKIAADQKGPA